MIVKHFVLKKCIENSIGDKNTAVKMWREQFFQSYYSRRLLWKKGLKFIECQPTKFCNVSVKSVQKKIPI